MKKLYWLLILSFIYSTLQAQTWYKPYQLGGNYISQGLLSVRMADANTGWAVGNNGIIVKTTSGQQWYNFKNNQRW